MKQILIIEDEADNCRLIGDVLKSKGYDVLIATDGASGIQLALDHKPDLIVSDINMPEMNGFAVLTTLRNHPATVSIPFIFLSALDDARDIRSGMGLGADDYLTKPFYMQDLLSAVRVRLEKQDQIARETEHRLEELRRNIAHALPHEFRTPLSIVMGFSTLLAEDADSGNAQMINSILRSANRLQMLTEKFWTYVETEIIAASHVSSASLQANMIENAAGIIHAAGLEIAQDFNRANDLLFEVEDAPLRISEQHLSLIINEITHNAFKFSDPGTPVEIIAKPDATGYSIRITNQGRGMSAEQLTRIGAFMQFEREQYEQKGVGLGLTISRRLAELYGGSLQIESVPNLQTTITIRLCLAQG